MPTVILCSECGAELGASSPQGCCYRCLLLLGLPSEDPFQPVLPSASFEGPPSPDLGTLGNYRLIKEISRGGMGIVYRALQEPLGRQVAVKVVAGGPTANQEVLARFRAEAEAAGRLQHPSIVAIHEIGEQDGQVFFSMDFLPGGDLSARVAGRPFPALRAAELVRELAQAVHYAHSEGILHRDLKPSNVLLDKDDRPHIADFGIACVVSHPSPADEEGNVFGSPNFMPPEQAGMPVPAGRTSDIYGLGGILFYLLTGRPPFVAETVAETLQQVLTKEPISPKSLNPSVPADLATICLKCLEKPPHRRYATAAELAEDLTRFLEDRPVRARPLGVPARAFRWTRRNPFPTALMITLAHGLVTSLALLYFVDQARRKEIAIADYFRTSEEAVSQMLAFTLPHIIEKFENLWSQPEVNSILIPSEAIGAMAEVPKTLAPLQPKPHRYVVGLMVKERPTTTARVHADFLNELETALSHLLGQPCRLDVRFYKYPPDLIEDVRAGRTHLARIAALPFLRGQLAPPQLRPLVYPVFTNRMAVIFTRPNSGIHSLADIRGQRFAFGDTNATVSFLAKKRLMEAGITGDHLYYDHLDSTEEFIEAVNQHGLDAAIQLLGPLTSHTQSIERVLDGTYDVGVAMLWNFLAHKSRGLIEVIPPFPTSPTTWVASPEVPESLASAFITAMTSQSGVWLERLPDRTRGFSQVTDTTFATEQQALLAVERSFPLHSRSVSGRPHTPIP